MQRQPDPLDGTIQTHDHGSMSVARAAHLFKLDEIVERYGDWAVTEYGLECLATCYTIPAYAIHYKHWHAHMADKDWVDGDDFDAALDAARRRHPEPTQRTLWKDACLGTDVLPTSYPYDFEPLCAALQFAHSEYHAMARGDEAPRRMATETDPHYAAAVEHRRQATWSAFAHLLDAFFEVISREDLCGKLWLYRRLLSYSVVEFFVWTNQAYRDSLDHAYSPADTLCPPPEPVPSLN